MGKEKNVTLGLSSQVALEILQRDVIRVLKDYEYGEEAGRSRIKKCGVAWLPRWLEAFNHRSQYTLLCWTSVAALLLDVIVLVVVYFIRQLLPHDSTVANYAAETELPIQGILIFGLLLFNIFLVVLDDKLRRNEMPERVRGLIRELEVAQHECKWEAQNYPHLYSPFSPCLTLQWTYRDGQVVNLPWALLVQGDTIVLRPGQQAPGLCVPLEDPEGPVLSAKQIFGGNIRDGEEEENTDKQQQAKVQERIPLENKKYKLQETPYSKNLRMALDLSLDRPVSFHNRKRHLIMIRLMERLAWPILAFFVLAIDAARFFYLSANLSTYLDQLLLRPIAVTLPLLPLVFPAAWLFFNALGMARFQVLFDSLARQRYQSSDSGDPFMDANGSTSASLQDSSRNSWLRLGRHILHFLLGRGDTMLCRSTNIVHVLGSVTALCCVDKKGILSWPNPTAEKVFFLRRGSVANVEGEGGEAEEPQENASEPALQTTTSEVLDLTHDHEHPFRVHFDDHTWPRHLDSLKPLGLAVLVNTCNLDTQRHYAQFCCHLACEAHRSNDKLVPVINRRCLCELAKEIGFQIEAGEIFKLEQQLSTFRHLQGEIVRRDIKFAKSLSIGSKLKFPFPHMVGALVKRKEEKGNGKWRRGRAPGEGLQLLSQGTADIVLDSCVEFWDGRELRPLTPSERKKAQDFYQRTSLTSYCTAFAYRPVAQTLANRFSEIYLELPPLAVAKSTCQTDSSSNLATAAAESEAKKALDEPHSKDPLSCNLNTDHEVSDVESCYEAQRNQIFLGMVTMQYQALIDMIQLIEQLERACIRFVHFSKENELRSRVFSEKMGLESGWNCHISLLSEKTRLEESPSPAVTLCRNQQQQQWSRRRQEKQGRVSKRHHENRSLRFLDRLPISAFSFYHRLDGKARAMSMSAPSAINADSIHAEDRATKAEEQKEREEEEEELALYKKDRGERRVRSEDSVLIQSMELGSCDLHDEAWRSLSCFTDSTEQSAPINFDMSNRAKLPRGIEKIRPHIEMIDNVPLLVSLFTDCNTAVTREMLHIMQEYGEIVCVFGSSANAENMPIFMQADAGIAVEPMYPQVCQRVPALVETREDQGISPTLLSRKLNSVACSLSVKREDPISLSYLVQEARHYVKSLWNCVQFWLCCLVTLSLSQALSAFFLLPPLLSIGQVLWLICLVIPLLATSMMATPVDDSSIMLSATGKNQCMLDEEVALFVMWCYGGKLLTTTFAVVIWQAITLTTLCTNYAAKAVEVNLTCFYVYPTLANQGNSSSSRAGAIWTSWEARDDHITFPAVQHFALTFLTTHFVVISACFVHRDFSIFRKRPCDNRVWLLNVILVLSFQLAYSGKVFYDYCVAKAAEPEDDGTVALLALLYLLCTIPLTFCVNELIKWQEIKANVRYQKRARLEFGTKLGMNSPF